MNVQTTAKILSFLKLRDVKAEDIYHVDIDFQTESLDIIYVSSEGTHRAQELMSREEIEEFLEFLANDFREIK